MSLGDAATLSPGLLVRMLTLAKGLEQGADEALNPSICRTRLLGLPPDIMERGGEELHQEQSLRRDASCQQGGGGGGMGRQDIRRAGWWPFASTTYFVPAGPSWGQKSRNRSHIAFVVPERKGPCSHLTEKRL